MLDEIERFADSHIRPVLRKDGGDLRILCLEDHILWVQALGKCSHCSSLHDTIKSFVEKEVKARFPDVMSVEVYVPVDAQLNELAKKILRKEIQLG